MVGAVVAVEGARIGFVQQHQRKFGASVFVFECVPQPLVKLAFAGDIVFAALVVKVQLEALALDF